MRERTSLPLRWWLKGGLLHILYRLQIHKRQQGPFTGYQPYALPRAYGGPTSRLSPTSRRWKSTSTWLVWFPTPVGGITIDSDIGLGILLYLTYYKSLCCSKRFFGNVTMNAIPSIRIRWSFLFVKAVASSFPIWLPGYMHKLTYVWGVFGSSWFEMCELHLSVWLRPTDKAIDRVLSQFTPETGIRHAVAPATGSGAASSSGARWYVT